MKKRITFVFVVLLSCAVFAQNSAAIANRRTAMRYLQLAKQSASEKQWSAAQSQAELGLAYDETIADLWYITAVAQSMQGTARATLIPLIEKALHGTDWVDYNCDNARILYADLLGNTGRFSEAVALLDEAPLLYSADAEYIRAKAFYNLHTDADVQKAREKIDAARRIYPHDARFAKLFFAHEYNLYKNTLYAAERRFPPLVQKLIDAFCLQVAHYADADAELELYAAIFAAGGKQRRMLNSFKARGLKAPLYAEAALRTGLLSEDEALDEFTFFADSAIDRSVLEAFVGVVKEENSKRYLAEYFNAYNGAVFADTDGDLQPNLTVAYVRGRPAVISYDANQDGVQDWSAECDFGVPQQVRLEDEGVAVQYAAWPWIQKVLYLTDKETISVEFNLIGETLAWSPFTVQVLAPVRTALSLDFFFPVLVPDSAVASVSAETLLKASTSYELAARERAGAKIHISVLDGVPQIARYYTAQGVLYAQAQFEAGKPFSRTVDTNGDGLFETTEYYGELAADAAAAAAEEMQEILTLFGSKPDGSRYYIRMIQIDKNGDTIPDFVEEYLTDGGKIASWDLDGNQLWDIRYIRYAPSADGVLREAAQFHQPLTDSIVTVNTENHVPVSVSDGVRNFAVTEASGMYWVGEAGSDGAVQEILQAVKQIGAQGVSIIVERKDSENSADDERMLAVRVGNMIFGELLPPSAAQDDEKATTE